ncbi:MAG TPA: transposase, partial [Bryobacteraceae bacterium]|nr:transposase [Bryobacteraceae bacterium]
MLRFQQGGRGRPRCVFILNSEVLRRACPQGSETIREDRDSLGRKLIDVPGYTFRVLVTSCADPPEQIWRDYNRRADMENRIAELKHDLGADGFCLKEFFATEAAFRSVLLLFNLRR